MTLQGHFFDAVAVHDPTDYLSHYEQVLNLGHDWLVSFMPHVLAKVRGGGSSVFSHCYYVVILLLC